MIFALCSLISCKRWDPDVQFENDIQQQRKELILRENRSNADKQSELNSFISYISKILLKRDEFLNWSEEKAIAYKITTRSDFNGENWETRNYEISSLVIAQYGSNSEMIKYYRKSKKPLNLTFITNGTRIISPSIF
jgi:hypothetical protein